MDLYLHVIISEMLSKNTYKIVFTRIGSSFLQINRFNNFNNLSVRYMSNVSTLDESLRTHVLQFKTSDVLDSMDLDSFHSAIDEILLENPVPADGAESSHIIDVLGSEDSYESDVLELKLKSDFAEAVRQGAPQVDLAKERDLRDADADYIIMPADNVNVISESSYSTMDFITESSILQSTANHVFTTYMTSVNAYVVPNSALDHFKNRSNAQQLSASKELYVMWQSRQFLQRVYFKSIFNACSKLTPIHNSYLRELLQRISSDPSNYSLPIYSMNSKNYLTPALFAYGVSVGGVGMHHFLDAGATKLKVVIKYVPSDVGESSANIEVNGLDTKYENAIVLNDLVFSKSVDSEPYSTNYGPINKSSVSSVLSSLYDVSGIATPSFVYLNKSDRLGAVQRSKDTTVFSEVSVTSANTFDDMIIDSSHPYLVDLFANLYHIDDFSHDEVENLVNYISTCVFKYIYGFLQTEQHRSLASYNFKIELVRKNATNSLSIFKTLVDKGLIVPMAPLQYSAYLDPDFDLDVWKHYILYANLGGLHLNKKFKSFCPIMDMKDREMFSFYAQNRHLLSSNHYTPYPSLPFQQDHGFSMRFSDLVLEMYVRSMLSGSAPDYFLLISDGEWKSGSFSSISISPAPLHPICKFGLNNETEHIRSIVTAFSLSLGGEVVVPSYIRSSTRLTQSMPEIYCRFLPGSSTYMMDSVSSELESGPSIYD